MLRRGVGVFNAELAGPQPESSPELWAALAEFNQLI